MKGLIAKLSRKRAIGLLVGDREVLVARYAFSPMGPIELDRVARAVQPGETIDAAVTSALGPLLDSECWKRAPLAIGLPVLRVFFSTRPIKAINRETSPQVLLHEVLQSSNLVIDDMDVDMIQSQPGKQPLASIIATRKKYLTPILDAVAALGVRPFQVEPAPFALLRAAGRRKRVVVGGGPRSMIRMFLGESSGLAVLSFADAPLVWREFDFATGNAGPAISSMVNSLRALSRFYGADDPPSMVLIHGRPDLGRLEELPGWPGPDVRVRRFDGPSYTPAETALGLALGCQAEAQGLNLARSLRPDATIFSMVPWAQIVAQAAVLSVATFLLADRADFATRQLRGVEDGCGRHPWMKDKPVAALETEKKGLTDRVESIGAHLGTRVLWSSCLAEIAGLVPESLSVTQLTASNELSRDKAGKGPGKGAKIEMGMQATIGAGGGVPPEIDTFLADLRAGGVIKRAMPMIKLTTLHWDTTEPGKKDVRPRVAFNVICQVPIAVKGKPSSH
jgi:hypothetical protein